MKSNDLNKYPHKYKTRLTNIMNLFILQHDFYDYCFIGYASSNIMTLLHFIKKCL